MRASIVAALVLAAGLAGTPALAGQAAPAAVEQFLGRTITDVRVDVSGVPVTEPGLLGLVETRVSEPLGMRNVRATIDHLVGLGTVRRRARVCRGRRSRAWRCAGS